MTKKGKLAETEQHAHLGRLTNNLAKLTPPNLRNTCARERLFTRLDQLRNSPAVWISAPGGSGKSTLVASYLQARDERAFWYQIDEGDADAASFFYHMGLLVQTNVSKRSLPLLTPEYSAGLSAFTQNYFRQFFAAVQSAGVLVLDNYQDLPSDAPLTPLLALALSESPENINTIIISRNDPPPAYARLRINGLLSVLSWDEIKFTFDECKAFISMPGGNAPPSNEDFEQLYEQTQGWIAAFVLMTEKIGQLPGAFHLSGHFDTLFDYFAGEVFQKLDQEVQSFLLKTALLTTINVEVANKLTHAPHAEQILKDLTRRNYFTVMHGIEPLCFEYHPLFRQFLLSKAGDTYSKDQLNEFRVEAASLLVTQGDVEQAIALHLAGEAYETATALIIKHADLFFQQGRNQTIIHWIEMLPEELRTISPALQYWLGQGYLSANPDQARQFFELAYKLSAQKNDLVGRLLSWCGVIETYIYESKALQPLDFWVGELNEILIDNPDLPSPEIALRVSCGMFLALMYRQPTNPDLDAWAERVRSFVHGDFDLRLRINIGAHLLLYDTWWRGDQIKAGALYSALAPSAMAADVPPLVQTTWCFISAAYFWTTAKHDEAIQAAKDGLAIAEQTGVHIWEMLTCGLGVFATLSSGQIDTAKTFLDRMTTLRNPSRNLDGSIYHYVSGWNALLQGNLAMAEGHARLAVGYSEKHGLPFYQALTQSKLARMVFYLGNENEAFTMINEVRAAGCKMKSHTVEYITCLIEAEFHMLNQDIKRCVHSLEHGLGVGKRQQFRDIGWWQSNVMSALYGLALEHEIETDYVRSIILERNLPPPESPKTSLHNWPWPVRIYTLGTLSLVINDEPVLFKGKTQQRSLDLLCALVSKGGKSVSAEWISSAVWPDAEADNAYHALESGLYRLRKLLGKQAVVLSGGQVTLNPKLCWIDIWAFNNIADQLEKCINNDIAKNQRNLYIKQLTDCYKGAFLRGSNTPWALETRERLQSRMFRILDMYIKGEEEAGNWQVVQSLLDLGLELNPLAEAFYRRLMDCHIKLGQNSEALTVYRRCQRILSVSLGIPPSQETTAIAHLIRNNTYRRA